MNGFLPALWAETLKTRRAGTATLSAVIFGIFPLVSGLFMIILKDPEAAKEMGLISVKAQLVAGSADWPAFFDTLRQIIAMAGPVLYAFIVTWIFGREFSDHTAKDLLALPTPRTAIVAAKFVLAALWTLGLSLMVFVMGLGVGALLDLPGWSPELARSTFTVLMTIAALTFALTPFVALVASAGGGYLPALGWAISVFIAAQLVSVLGWGDWFPWSVPVLLSGMFGPGGVEQVGVHSYILSGLAFIAGLGGTFTWWLRADQLR